MDFSYSEEEHAVQGLARQILEDQCDPEHLQALEDDRDGDGIDHTLWLALAEANLLGTAIPTEQGGSDLGLQALCVLLEEAGRFLAPLPLLPTLVCASLPIAEFGSEAQRERWLPDIAAGRSFLTAALEEVGSRHPAQCRTRARPSESGWLLDGEKICVPAADVAQCMLVPARLEGGGAGVFLVDPNRAGVCCEPARSNRHERQFRVGLKSVEVTRDEVLGEPGEHGAQILDWLDQRTQVALCALQLGVAAEALRRTADYTSTRKQFGRPIASFQAVALRAADAFVDIEAMRSTLWQASWRLSQGLPAAEQVAAAKWWACRGGQRVVHTAQHLHGGTGADIHYPIHRYFLWARQLELTLGGAGEQLRRLGSLLREAPVD